MQAGIAFEIRRLSSPFLVDVDSYLFLQHFSRYLHDATVANGRRFVDGVNVLATRSSLRAYTLACCDVLAQMVGAGRLPGLAGMRGLAAELRDYGNGDDLVRQANDRLVAGVCRSAQCGASFGRGGFLLCRLCAGGGQ